jgi:DNA-binding NtrC family response regulator
MAAARIMVIDDKDFMRDGLVETLSRAGYAVDGFGSARRALDAFASTRYDLLITDLRMPEVDGISVVRAVRNEAPETPALVITAYGTVESAVEAMKCGAFDYIQKPFKAEELELVVAKALEHGRLVTENQRLRTALADLPTRQLVGKGPEIEAVRQRMAQVAASSATVLVEGESGTGKELVAAGIHQLSDRGDGPLVNLNCASLSSNLMESELFGHERGAFTGADRSRRGRFEMAHGGTLLLDEVSEIDINLQAKLLRVLQEKEYERVGSSVTRKADVRVIATTNRDLRQATADGKFRKDLYYRLNVVPIYVPPLRLRRGDIPMLANHFLDRFIQREGRTPRVLMPEAVDALVDYDWPGNVRELENIIERASVLDLGPEIRVDHLASWLEPLPAGPADEPLRPGTTLDDMERRLILETLDHFGGHRARTAEALGIAVRTLSSKLKQYGEQRGRQYRRAR